MKTYIVTVSKSLSIQYLVEAENEEEAMQNYADGEEGEKYVTEEFPAMVELQ